MYFGVYERNIAPILAALTPILAHASGTALEIGSGTGQHILDFAKKFENLRWVPSDPNEEHRTSINAWRAHNKAPIHAALDLDAAQHWAAQADIQALAPLEFILSLNVIHIAPVSVAHGIFAGAGKTLTSGGQLAFYGPFREGGVHTGDGNATFDRRLRDDNPEWGIRDVDALRALATEHGLAFVDLIEMPANNRILLFRKS